MENEMDKETISTLMKMRVIDKTLKKKLREKKEKQFPFFAVSLVGLATVLTLAFFNETNKANINQEINNRLQGELIKHDELSRRVIELEKKHEELLIKLLLH